MTAGSARSHRSKARGALPEEVSVDPNVAVPGRLATHDADLSLRNGHLLLAAQGISFDRPHSRLVDKDVNEIAWFLDDIRQSTTPPELAVIVVPPADPTRPDFQSASSLFGELKAEVVRMNTTDAWAERVSRRITKNREAARGAS